MAADLPARTAPPAFIAPVAVPYSWTGFEVGLSTTYLFTNRQGAAIAPGAGLPSPVSLNKDGLANLGGGIGYNWQFTPGSGVVVGIKADADWTNLNKNLIFNDPVNGGYDIYHNRLTYLATINGRIGYAFDRFLVYGTGGFAFGGVNEAVGVGITGLAASSGSVNRTDTGYNFGGGVEYAIPPDSFLNNFAIERLIGIDKALGVDLSDGTIRAEFIHYDLGTDRVAVAPLGAGGVGYLARFHNEGNEVRFGLGYKFGGAVAAPVVARY